MTIPKQSIHRWSFVKMVVPECPAKNIEVQVAIYGQIIRDDIEAPHVTLLKPIYGDDIYIAQECTFTIWEAPIANRPIGPYEFEHHLRNLKSSAPKESAPPGIDKL